MRRINVSTYAVSSLCGNPLASGSSNGVGTNAYFYNPTGIAMDATGSVALVVRKWRHCAGMIYGGGRVARFGGDSHTTTASSCLLCLQADSVNQQIRRIDVSTGAVTVLAGQTTHGYANGVGTNATFYFPSGIALNAPGTVALVVSGAVSETYQTFLQRHLL